MSAPQDFDALIKAQTAKVMELREAKAPAEVIRKETGELMRLKSEKGVKAVATKKTRAAELDKVPVLVPNFRWAQDEENVFVTIEIGDVEDGVVEILPEVVKFSGKCNSSLYKVTMNLRFPVDPTESSYALKGREVEVLLKKKEEQDEFWPHFLTVDDKLKLKIHCKVDWDMWRDEDEDPKEGAGDFGVGDSFGGDYGDGDYDDDDDDDFEDEGDSGDFEEEEEERKTNTTFNDNHFWNDEVSAEELPDLD